VEKHFSISNQYDTSIKKAIKSVEFLLSIPTLDKKLTSLRNEAIKSFVNNFQEMFKDLDQFMITILAYLLLSPTGEIVDPENKTFQNQSIFVDWKIAKIIRELGSSYNFDEQQINKITQTIYTLLGLSDWYKNYSADSFELWFKQLLSTKYIQEFLEVNRYKEKLWFSKEKFELLVSWLLTLAIFEIGTATNVTTNSLIEGFIRLEKLKSSLLTRMEESAYLFNKLLID
jgi:hypothetical protein